MKAPVIVRFRDKETKKIHNVGTVYEGTQERIKELQGKKWLGDEIVESKTEDDKYLSTLNGTIDGIKSTVDGLKKSDYDKLIELEKEGKNRKSLIEFFEEQANIAGLAEPPNREDE
ncbi:hypothetical protein [Niallia sp. FSL W8-1348]|uniref:hypothetical protein n=1 Tax=Niallia sp. FSL W8-1348 TaxID=2954656 RepID=UPI0030FAA1B7